MRKLITVVIMSLLLCSCNGVINRRVTLTQFETGEVIVGTVNVMSHWISVTMPDGELLEGKFTTAGGNQAYALLKSAKGNLILELSVTYNESGSGFGDAHTNNGKQYRVQF